MSDPVPSPRGRKKKTNLPIKGRMPDGYNWLRDDNWEDLPHHPEKLNPPIKNYLESENTRFHELVQTFEHLKTVIADEMKGRITPNQSSVPIRDGDWEYWHEYNEGDNYPTHKRRHVPSDKTDILLDATLESAGSVFFDLYSVTHSPDHETLAYSIDHIGAESFDIRFRDLKTGQELIETLKGTKGDIVWSKDSWGVYYTECDECMIAKRVKLHVLGTDPEEDIIVYEELGDTFDVSIRKSHSGEYLFIQSQESETSEVRFLHTNSPIGSEPILIHARSAGHEYHVDHHNDDFYIRTNSDGAFNFKIMKTPIAAPEKYNWQEVTSVKSNSLIVYFITYKDFLVRQELKNGLPSVVVTDYENKESYVEFQDNAFHIDMIQGYEYDTDSTRIHYQTPANPGAIYDINLNTLEKEIRKEEILPNSHNPDDYIVEREFINARDGARVPVTTLRHKSTKPDGTSPLYMCGYGSYGDGLKAEFFSDIISLVDRGAVYALAHIRGGNEMGGEWYLNGRREHKQNTFNDFIDTAETLTDKGYGHKGKIIIQGESAGGLLMGAVINMRPDLFGGVVAGVPFVDVMNSMFDPSLPWVAQEWTEFGNPTKPDDHKNMQEYSPYDNINTKKKYPPILATTGLLDTRVMYWEPAKWILRLQTEAQGGPFYLKTNMNGGHLNSSARFGYVEQAAEEMAFALHLFETMGYDMTSRVDRCHSVLPQIEHKFSSPNPS